MLLPLLALDHQVHSRPAGFRDGWVVYWRTGGAAEVRRRQRQISEDRIRHDHYEA